MTPSSKKNSILIGVIVVCLLAIGYILFASGSAPELEGQFTTSSGESAISIDENGFVETGFEEAVGAELLEILSDLDSITLDSSVLSDPAYLQLQDKSIKLPDVLLKGRANPFLPYSTSSRSTETLDQGSVEAGGTEAPEIITPVG